MAEKIEKDDIVLRKMVLHVLDTFHGDCILSDALLDPGPDFYEFIRTHIYKIISGDDAKHCVFNPETSPVYKELKKLDEQDEKSFLSVSQVLAERLYAAMGEGNDIPAADLLVVSFQARGKIFLALLKMNYRASFVHQIEDDRADVIVSRGLLPASGTKIPEAAVIDLQDMGIQLLEKKYEVQGEKMFYLSERFLVCHTQAAPKQKFTILNRVVNNISNKYDGADLQKKMDMKSNLQKMYTEEQQFDVEKVGQELFGTRPDEKAEFDEKMEQYDLQFDTFSISNPSTLKKLEKQVLVADNGIEISIPMETYNKRAAFEIKQEPGGKTTIILREIENLILK